MSSANSKNARRRKKSRSFKKFVTGIVLAPGKLPRLNAEALSRIMRICESVAVIFVAVLMLHMAIPELVGIGMVVGVGIIFAGFLVTIAISDYQDKLVEYDLYGFKI